MPSVFIHLYSNRISELDLGEDWPESEDESEDLCGSESLPADIVNKAERKNSQIVKIVPDQRKSSTGSNVMTPLIALTVGDRLNQQVCSEMI